MLSATDNMNEHLQEIFDRSSRPQPRDADDSRKETDPPVLNPKVREYVQDAARPVDAGPWLHRPEIPSAGEVLDLSADGSSSSEAVELEPNRPEGPWESKELYLAAHYELLREAAVRPIREAVQKVRESPNADENALEGLVDIYAKVHICAIFCSPRGVATKVTFSLARTGKMIMWEQSKRLLSGSIVVLTPKEDMFQSKAIVATVAARPIAGLALNPPEVDLFIRAEEQVIDPAQEYVMIAHRGSLYEASRHTLLALQKMMREPFPLAEHLLSAQQQVAAPVYLQKRPKLDMSSVFTHEPSENYESVNVLQSWPQTPASELDQSQFAALRRILTKRLAVVQGPPGTGKTHVSVKAVKIMLDNLADGDGPIIVACQTNHAVDQLLQRIAEFEPDFIRLGARSKEKDIKARTLYQIRVSTDGRQPPGCLLGHAYKKMKQLTKEIEELLAPLLDDHRALDTTLLVKLGLLTEQQATSLSSVASKWVRDDVKNEKESQSPFRIWLGKSLVEVSPKQLPEDHGFEYEEADLEIEQLKEAEAENAANDDDDFEQLPGDPIPIADNFTCPKAPHLSKAKIQSLMQQSDMRKIPQDSRPAIYRYLQAEQKNMLCAELRKKCTQYNKIAADRRTGLWEKDENILKKARVIGMTTTGLSKYRGLLAALEPKIALIEEAAETLEAPVAVACLPSLEHLILVGDHQQLRPQCNFRDHEGSPFFLNISLFERLIRNNIEFDTLSKQRRMRPEFRRLIYPFYENRITDHDSVNDPERRPDVPGMGGVNSFWLTHEYPEKRDEQMSCFNPEEAEMVIGFVEYLVYNGVKCENITVLTFYNGQRKRILRGLRLKVTLGGQVCKVVTVDSYQGEENQIVILSLVRSNNKNQIGFLSNDNRVCVALSRAQSGFYIFGNGNLLHSVSKNGRGISSTWKQVVEIMANFGTNQADHLKVEPTSRLGQELPLRCGNHNNLTSISEPGDWDKIVGGCSEQCLETRPCGHRCELKCHPFSHDIVPCSKPCGKPLNCGHKCSKKCGDRCSCSACDKKRDRAQAHNKTLSNTTSASQDTASSSDSSNWKAFAKTEPERYAAAAAAATPTAVKPASVNGASSMKQSADLLINFDDEVSISKPMANLSLDSVVMKVTHQNITTPIIEATKPTSKSTKKQKKSARNGNGIEKVIKVAEPSLLD